MAKSKSKPLSDFDKFAMDNLDRVIEDRADGSPPAPAPKPDLESVPSGFEPPAEPRPYVPDPPQPVSSSSVVVRPDPITEDVMRRRHLPAAYLHGASLAPVTVRPGTDTLLVEVHALLADLQAGGAIVTGSILIWDRVNGLIRRLRAAIEGVKEDVRAPEAKA